jgi:histone acetyltransferase (RNA polymerase elongator complex component)
MTANSHRQKKTTPLPAKPGRPFIIPIFIPHDGCPHQCVFCNQYAITGETDPREDPGPLRGRIHQYLKYRGHRRDRTQIAFYGGNFLGLPRHRVSFYLDIAQECVASHGVDGIRFSTRPDSVTPERLGRIRGYPVETVELGVQSMDDAVLAMSRRGHTAEDSEMAVGRLRGAGYRVGAQMMVGLPGEDDMSFLESGRRVVELRPDFVRIYPTLVVARSPLASWYREGRYKPLSLEAAVFRTKSLFTLFQEHRIPVIRMGLQMSEDLSDRTTLVAGPHHPAFGDLVYSALFCEKIETGLRETRLTKTVTIRVHPRDVSKARGHRNQNLRILTEKFSLRNIQIFSDPRVAQGIPVVVCSTDTPPT